MQNLAPLRCWPRRGAHYNYFDVKALVQTLLLTSGLLAYSLPDLF